MKTRRLLKLIEILKRVPDEQFSMSTWMLQNHCGTVGCALGHACLDKGFRRAGLKLSCGSPTFGHSYTYSAAAGFFGITGWDAHYLFDPVLYSQRVTVTKDIVVNRIHHFIKERGRQSL